MNMATPPPVATAGASANDAVAELAAIPKWVCWRAVKRGDKITKVPYTPAGSLASSTDPVTWSTFNECWTAAFADGHFDGIGIVLDGTDGLVGSDLDSCVQDGFIDNSAAETVALFNSYSEISPSGTGIRIICRGTTLEPGRRNGKIELYSSKRFLTITGRHIPTAPEQIRDAQRAIDTLWAKHFSESRRRTNSNSTGSSGALPPYLDQEAIDALLRPQPPIGDRIQ
jgi:putative DNA primase/helicase